MPEDEDKPEDPEQYERFLKKAEEIGCDPDPKVFEKIGSYKPPKKH